MGVQGILGGEDRSKIPLHTPLKFSYPTMPQPISFAEVEMAATRAKKPRLQQQLDKIDRLVDGNEVVRWLRVTDRTGKQGIRGKRRSTVVDFTRIGSVDRPLTKERRDELEDSLCSQIATDVRSVVKRGRKYLEVAEAKTLLRNLLRLDRDGLYNLRRAHVFLR